MLKSIIFPDLDSIKKTAVESARDVCERWDVPRGSQVPEHLRDEAPRFWKTRDGLRVTSRLKIVDVLTGSASVVQLGLASISATLLALAALLSLISPGLASIYLLAIAFFYWVTATPAVGRFLLLFIASGILTSGSELAALCMLFAVLFGFQPLLVDLFYSVGREADLLEQSLKFSGESAADKAMMYEAHIPARRAQAEAAANDKSPVFRFGAARGVLARLSQDPFAPDEGQSFCISLKDLQESHLWVWGTTGSGKTSGVLRRVLAFWVSNRAGGALIADGKGNLGHELGQLPGVNVIRPGVTEFALIEGLNAEEVVAVFANSGVSGSAKGDFFVNNAARLLLKALIILEHACQLDAPAYAWTLQRALQMIVDVEYRAGAIEALRDSGRFDELIHSGSFLASAISFFETEWPNMAMETRSGIEGQVMAWINPLVANRHLYKWAATEKGFDVTSVLTGSVVALATNPAVYGPAGNLVTALAKARVYRALKQRSDAWCNTQGQTNVLILIDEAQELISEAEEGSMLAIGRSLGACFCMAAQSLNALIARFQSTGGSRDGALAMRGNFKSVVSFQATATTIDDDIRPALGCNMRRTAVSKTDGIAYDQIANSLIESGGLRPRSRLLRLYLNFSTPGELLGSLWGAIKPRSVEHDPSERRPDDESSEKDLQIATGYKMEVKPVLEKGEAEIFLAEPGVALCQVRVGGVIRRDFVKVDQMFSFDDLQNTSA